MLEMGRSGIVLFALAFVVGTGCGAPEDESLEPDMQQGEVSQLDVVIGDIDNGDGGGGAGKYECNCSDHVGTWTGTYSSQSTADADLKVYCRDQNGDGTYGTCKKQ